MVDQYKHRHTSRLTSKRKNSSLSKGCLRNGQKRIETGENEWGCGYLNMVDKIITPLDIENAHCILHGENGDQHVTWTVALLTNWVVKTTVFFFHVVFTHLQMVNEDETV